MTQLLNDNYLSRYFGDLQTMMVWLDRLGGLDVVQAGTKYIAALPMAYSLNVDWDHYNRMMGGEKPATIDGLCRDKFIPARYEVTEDSQLESLCTLARSILGHFNQCSTRRIYVHQPELGVPEVKAMPYYGVRNKDPWHDHASREQIHFTAAFHDPENKDILRAPFEEHHVHLIHPDLIW